MNREVSILTAWFFLAAVSCFVTGARSEAGLAPPLKFVTFNLFHGGVLSGLTGDARQLDRHLEIVAEELRDLKADIMGLQEASTSWQRGDVAARLASRLGFHRVFAAASSRFFSSQLFNRLIASLLNFTEGPAIVSRFPIVNWEVHDLPRCGKFMDSRVLLFATLQTPWGSLRVFSTHTRGDPCQTRRVVELVRARHGPLPSILMGDFNAAPGSAAIATLRDEAGFIDAFGTAHPNEAGLSVWQQIDAPGPTVGRRGDYVFLVPGEEFPGRILSSRLILNAPRHLPDGKILWPSDHYGVLAVMEVLAPQSR